MKPTVSLLLLLITILSFGQNNSSLYSFFVAGHTYGEPGVNNIGFHPPFKNKFGYIKNRPEIKFGVLAGDIVSAFPVAQDWDEIDADLDTLGLPVYFAVGNHDMENRPLFESRYGRTYYQYTYKNDLFIVLDPLIDGWSITGAQLDFLKKTINDNYTTVDNVFVFFHQLLWYEYNNQFNYLTWNSGAGRVSPVNFWSTVEPLFRAIPNEVFMFAGDLGASWSSNVTYDHFSNIRLIATGMGDKDRENFIVVNIDSNKSVSYDVICLSDTNINCLGSLESYLTVDSVPSTIGINDIDLKQNDIVIFPNPAKNSINIQLEKNENIQLFSIEGELVYENSYNNKGIHSINVSAFPRGIYFTKIASKENYLVKKIILN